MLRYWEQEFTQLKPVKRRGNRRYYQHHEVLLIRRIRELLYEQGFTISGARNRLDNARLDHARIDAEEKSDPSAPRELRVVPGSGVDVAAIKRDNLMDVRPGVIDRSTLGHPGKFSYCLAEDEEDSSWKSLSEQRGVERAASAVTVMAAGAPRQIMNEWTTKPEEILETFAAEMRANLRHYSIHPGNYAIVVPKQLREHLQAANWSKTDIANFIHERARIHRREWAEVGKGAVVRDRGDSVYPAMESPDQLLVIAAGGPAGGFGAVIPPWLGNKSHAVTLPIGACVDCEPPKK